MKHGRIQWRGAIAAFGIGCALLASPSSATYVVSVDANATPDPASFGISSYDFLVNGDTSACTPTGPGTCSPISATGSNPGNVVKAFGSVDLTTGSLRTSSSVTLGNITSNGAATAFFDLSGTVNVAGAGAGSWYEIIVHTLYRSVDGGGTARSKLEVHGTGGGSGDQNVSFILGGSPNANSYIERVDNFDVFYNATGGVIPFSFRAELSSSAVSGSSEGFADIWLELPDGATFSGVGDGPPTAAPPSQTGGSGNAPVPATPALLVAALALLGPLRRGVRPTG
jgi:hypothetical protein